MAETEFAGGGQRCLGWDFQELFWGRVHGWLHEASQRAAFVAAGDDSLERAKALLAEEPGTKIVCDATAARFRRAAPVAFQ